MQLEIFCVFFFSVANNCHIKSKNYRLKYTVIVFCIILNGLHFVTRFIYSKLVYLSFLKYCVVNVYHAEGHGAEANFPQIFCSQFSIAVISNAASQMHMSLQFGGKSGRILRCLSLT